jgi:hypothetical protein
VQRGRGAKAQSEQIPLIDYRLLMNGYWLFLIRVSYIDLVFAEREKSNPSIIRRVCSFDRKISHFLGL